MLSHFIPGTHTLTLHTSYIRQGSIRAVQGIFGVGRKPISHDGSDKQGAAPPVSPHPLSPHQASQYFYILLELHVEQQSPSQSPPRLAQRYIGITWHQHNKLNWQKLTQGEKINFHLFPRPVCLSMSATSCARKCSKIRKTEARKVLQKCQ